MSDDVREARETAAYHYRSFPDVYQRVEDVAERAIQEFLQEGDEEHNEWVRRVAEEYWLYGIAFVMKDRTMLDPDMVVIHEDAYRVAPPYPGIPQFILTTDQVRHLVRTCGDVPFVDTEGKWTATDEDAADFHRQMADLLTWC